MKSHFGVSLGCQGNRVQKSISPGTNDCIKERKSRSLENKVRSPCHVARGHDVNERVRSRDVEVCMNRSSNLGLIHI